MTFRETVFCEYGEVYRYYIALLRILFWHPSNTEVVKDQVHGIGSFNKPEC